MKHMKTVIFGALAALALSGTVITTAMAQSSECGVQDTRARLREYDDAVSLGSKIIERNLQRQVHAIHRFHSLLTHLERDAILDAADEGEGVPDWVMPVVRVVEHQFNYGQCLDDQFTPEFIDGRWYCQSDSDDELLVEPLIVREFFVSDIYAYACTEMSKGEGIPDPHAPSEVDFTAAEYYFRSCTRIDLRTGQVDGSTLRTSLDQDVVEDDVYAEVNGYDLLGNPAECH